MAITRILRASAVTVATLASLAGTSANALTVTTQYIPFKAFLSGNAVVANDPTNLSFQGFGAVTPGPTATLTGVTWLIRNTAFGGQTFITNQGASAVSVDGNQTAGRLQITPTVTGVGALTGNTVSPFLTCIFSEGFDLNGDPFSPANCPTGNQLVGDLGSGGGAGTFALSGNYNVTSPVTASLNPAQVASFSGSTVQATYGSIFTGMQADVAYEWAPVLDPYYSLTSQAYLQGEVALQYTYTLPPVPGATVPAPLPSLGAIFAFNFSRRLRKRIEFKKSFGAF